MDEEYAKKKVKIRIPIDQFAPTDQIAYNTADKFYRGDYTYKIYTKILYTIRNVCSIHICISTQR